MNLQTPEHLYKHSFTRADVKQLEAEIKALLPEAQTDRWCDYGFTLWVRLGDRVICACQPERRGFQHHIWQTAEEVKRKLQDGTEATASSPSGE